MENGIMENKIRAFGKYMPNKKNLNDNENVNNWDGVVPWNGINEKKLVSLVWNIGYSTHILYLGFYPGIEIFINNFVSAFKSLVPDVLVETGVKELGNGLINLALFVGSFFLLSFLD